MMVLIIALSYNAVRKQFIAMQITDLRDLNASLSVSLLSVIDLRNNDLDQLTKSLGSEIQARITVVDTIGKVLADSESDPLTMKNHRRRPEIEQALSGNIAHARRFSTTVEKNMLYVASPLVKNGQIVAVVRTSIYLSHLNNLFHQIINRIVKISLLVIIVALSAAFLLARRYSKPINQLVSAARQIEQGKLETRVNIHTNDELDELAESFNAMTAELNRLLTDFARQRDELQTIVSAVPSGLLVLNAAGRVAFYNREFQKIATQKEIQDKYYWEILRQPQFTEFIKGIQENRSNRTQEIGIDDKTYLCSATADTTGGEIVLIFSDISELKAVQRLKRDFVVNVSHELRTPLTAIKGFVETLQEESAGDEHRYLTIIARHTERLINIVNDLLTLSELEEKNQIEYEPVDLGDLLPDTVKIFEEHLQAKNLAIEIETDSPLIVRADPFKLQQVLINLLDNAIKYTEKGKVTVKAHQVGNEVQITIADTGCGIPAEHLSRIFERFYVVDKSRSRQLGGTGLGLAIAKHIVLLHNGHLAVESQPEKGTIFKIILPCVNKKTSESYS
ncbi:MAG: cell wall metabolism sensor histidine kinase WalK [Candidatus Marinimicrobia bacterium]|jgi:two-component system phosphate regulon sensor histidine kinase PhoR|nr:cell wall metabolism sensor histidine kinase WalK [Candidatus Neomarinimicrobiota bacterium]MCK9559380.1 cell wall metabolism sensor histidine kinase WalK [Candidatus Neomarinimicrobiota bacterium]